MFRVMFLTLLAFASASAGMARAACSGADPAIESVAVKKVTHSLGVNRYTLSGTVVNLGSAPQAGNVLQFVDIYHVGVKLDAKGIPPLQPRQGYTFSYDVSRADESGNGTTTLTFRLDMRQPASPGLQDCNPRDDSFTVTF